MELAALKNEIATACGETASLDFKSMFDPGTLRDWVETIKDIVAMHNSGGGVIVFGLNSDGSDAGSDAGLKAPVDPAHIVDKLRKYTGQVLPGITLERFEKNGKAYDGWIIDGGSVPVPFKEPGTWERDDRRQETAFSRGQLYFRHGAKSDPASFDDMREVCQRVAESARVSFASEMQNVARLPDGYTVQAVPPGVVVSIPTAVEEVRITNDPTAPGCVIVDKFNTHPYRQKDLIARLVSRVPECKLNQFDIQCIRRTYREEIEGKGLVYQPPHSAPYFSDDLVEWIAGRIEAEPDFLIKTRAMCKKSAAA